MELRIDKPVSLRLSAAGELNPRLSIGYKVTSGATDLYTGDYEVRPSVDAQMLATQGKTMKRDVTVKRIPRYAVSNDAGGTTFTIGANIGD